MNACIHACVHACMYFFFILYILQCMPTCVQAFTFFKLCHLLFVFVTKKNSILRGVNVVFIWIWKLYLFSDPMTIIFWFFFPQRAFMGALDLSYLGVTIENMCRRHYRAPGHHYQYMDTSLSGMRGQRSRSWGFACITMFPFHIKLY